jgi:uncharacterized membrane protein
MTTTATQGRSSGGLLLRSSLLGVAAGGRSSLGIAGPLVAHGTLARVAALGLVLTEMTVDKLPGIPSRLAPPVLLSRAAAGGVGGGVLAHRQGAGPVVPAIVAAVGAVVGSAVGTQWREVAARVGYTWQAAVAEDLVASGLTWLAMRDTNPAA